MKTVQLVFHFQGITRFNLAVVDGEPILYGDDTMVTGDRDFWLNDAEVDRFLADPFGVAPPSAQSLREKAGSNWVVEVTEYTALESTKYQPFEIESRGKARRRAELLAQMTPEDRALFA